MRSTLSGSSSGRSIIFVCDSWASLALPLLEKENSYHEPLLHAALKKVDCGHRIDRCTFHVRLPHVMVRSEYSIPINAKCCWDMMSVSQEFLVTQST